MRVPERSEGVPGVLHVGACGRIPIRWRAHAGDMVKKKKMFAIAHRLRHRCPQHPIASPGKRQFTASQGTPILDLFSHRVSIVQDEGEKTGHIRRRVTTLGCQLSWLSFWCQVHPEQVLEKWCSRTWSLRYTLPSFLAHNQKLEMVTTETWRTASFLNSWSCATSTSCPTLARMSTCGWDWRKRALLILPSPLVCFHLLHH